MAKKKRIILRFPDGTYSHGNSIQTQLVLALNFGDNDSWLEMKLGNDQPGPRRGANINRIQILQIEDEVEYIINSIDFILDPEMVTASLSFSRQ